MTHLLAALRAGGDRDVVAMTVRLVGIDVPDDPTVDPRATDDERTLLSAVVALAERERRAVRLLIVPGRERVRLGRSRPRCGSTRRRFTSANRRRCRPTIRRGCSARRGSAPRSRSRAISGSSSTIRAAASPRISSARMRPRSSPEDFDQIHRLWLDVAGAVGPHVHHRDVVRAALKHMENELSGPDREAALQLVRETARPADELAAVLRARDFARLRDMLRNRPASDLASMLTDLPTRRSGARVPHPAAPEAAATFEYLSTDEQNALLKAMASEDVAALLNEMAPDDRTMFLEELPGRGDAAAARAAHAGGARRRGHAARLSRRIDRAV